MWTFSISNWNQIKDVYSLLTYLDDSKRMVETLAKSYWATKKTSRHSFGHNPFQKRYEILDSNRRQKGPSQTEKASEGAKICILLKESKIFHLKGEPRESNRGQR